MKLLETTENPALSFFSRARHAITTSASSLLTWAKMLLSVGFVITGAVILGVLLDVMVRIHNYRNGTRIVIPSFDDDGDINYFAARSYNGDSYKYKNPRASKNIIFNELFVDWSADLTIVEGAFDAIVAGNAVPILGSTLRKDSRLLRKIVLNDTPIYLALDPDAIEKERRLIQMLLRYDIELYKINISGYEDVGAMSKEDFFKRKKEASFIDGDNYLLLNLLSAI
jgi:hypothetical protein